jgi:radial spoke head protein 9
MGIDVNTLLLDVDNLAYSGIVLNAEQRAALQTSLVVQRDQYKFNRIYFWGKIIGTKEDYFIAQGVSANELADKKSLYSHDCVRWRLLNPPTEDHLNLLDICKGRFTGDPSNEYDCKILTVVGEGDEEHIDEDVVSILLYL